jgi:hypothetical protein
MEFSCTLMRVSCMLRVNKLRDYSITTSLATDPVLTSANSGTSLLGSRKCVYASHNPTMLPSPHARVWKNVTTAQARSFQIAESMSEQKSRQKDVLHSP